MAAAGMGKNQKETIKLWEIFSDAPDQNDDFL